jgi:hypothetical protein
MDPGYGWSDALIFRLDLRFSLYFSLLFPERAIELRFIDENGEGPGVRLKKRPKAQRKEKP